jgi:tetratricopeptide (TPR) repeat protein/predicted Ser/Thr protein kinase
VSEPLPPSARARLLADARVLADARGPTQEPGVLLHGRYRLVRELGRGGMGVVHEAEDVALRRRVALKVLVLPAHSGPGLASEVLREARAAARLSHPNIAAVYDAHDDAIAMQLVDGSPLSEIERPDVRRLAGWIRDAALAVHYAHEQGIVHRDLKPHNLMIEGERVVVMDFGLAKELALDASASVSKSVVGTPSYMPPEQAGGRAREVDARSDVYALGATLYDRLAGRPPFVAPDLVSLLRAVVEDEPAPLVSLAPDVPRDLALIVHRALEKEKERRYATARELADDLGRWLAGEPVRARPPSLRYRLGKLVRRHRALVASGTALAVVALAALAWNAAERARRSATEQALDLVEHVNLLLDNAEERVREDAADADALLDRGIAACEAFLAVHESPLVRAKLGRLLRERRRFPEAQAAFDRALELEPGYAPARLERGLLSAQLYTERRVLAALAGESPPELAELRAGALADLAVIETERDDLRHVDVLLAEAQVDGLEGRTEEAGAKLARFAELYPTRLEAPRALAPLALERGDSAEALAQAMRAMDLYRGLAPAYAAQGTPDTPDDAVARAIRQHRQAALAAGLAIEGIEGVFEDWTARLAESPSTAAAYANHGQGEVRRAGRLTAEGHGEEALTALDRAAQDLTNALTIAPDLAPAHGDRALVELARARALELLGRAAEARAALARAQQDLARALELAPGSAPLLANRALVERRAQELGSAPDAR